MKRTWFPRLVGRPATARDERQNRVKFRPQVQSLESRDVPATFFFDPDAVDDGSGNATFNEGRPDEHIGVFNPATPIDGAVYNSLDRAIAAAAALAGRDTIRISADEIDMSPEQPASPDELTLNTGDFNDTGGVDVIGSGVGNTILKPNYDSSSPLAFGGVLNFYGNGSYSLSGLTIDAAGKNFATGIAVNDTNTSIVVNDVAFQNIRFPSNGTQFGIAVNIKNGAEAIVTNSTFSGIGQIGISIRDTGGSLQAHGNTYTGKGAGSAVDYFISVIDGATALITGNRVTNNTGVNGTTRSAAVLIGDSPEPGGPASAQIYGNSFGLLADGTVAANDSGVIVGFGNSDMSTADIRFNNLVGGRGVTGNISASAQNIIAFYNYWGSTNGPSTASNPGGTGAAATSNVNFGPIRSGPVTATTGTNLADVIGKLSLLGPTLAVGPGTGSGNDGAATTLALNNQGNFNATPGQSVGQRTTIGDVNRDGVNDIIVASGPGTGGLITIFDGKTQAQLFQFSVMDGFTGGLFVAAADFNRDGFGEVVIVPDSGGGTRVLVYDFSSGQPVQVQSFYALEENLRTGLTVALGDVNGDNTPDIVVVAGPGGGPRTAFFNGAEVFSSDAPSRLFNDQYLYDENSRDGFFIALGDVDGDGIADVMLSSNTGGSTLIQIWDGSLLNEGVANTLFSVTANPGSNGVGVRIAAVDLNGDARADLVAGDGPGSSTFRVFYANTGSLSTGTPDATVDLLNISVGIYVG